MRGFVFSLRGVFKFYLNEREPLHGSSRGEFNFYFFSKRAAKKPSVWYSPGVVWNCPASSNNFFASTPCATCAEIDRAASTAVTRRCPGDRRRASSTTSSFSSGSSEQVE